MYDVSAHKLLFVALYRSEMSLRGKSVRSWCDGSSVDPLSCFSFQPVLHDWCNKGRGMCYPVCGGGAYKITLAANGKE